MEKLFDSRFVRDKSEKLFRPPSLHERYQPITPLKDTFKAKLLDGSLQRFRESFHLGFRDGLVFGVMNEVINLLMNRIGSWLIWA
jgi:hypothetical protein